MFWVTGTTWLLFGLHLLHLDQARIVRAFGPRSVPGFTRDVGLPSCSLERHFLLFKNVTQRNKSFENFLLSYNKGLTKVHCAYFD